MYLATALGKDGGRDRLYRTGCGTGHPPDIFHALLRTLGGGGGAGPFPWRLLGRYPPAPAAPLRPISFPSQSDAQRCHLALCVQSGDLLAVGGAAEDSECFNLPRPHTSQVKAKLASSAELLPGACARPVPTGCAAEHRFLTAVEVGRGCGAGKRS